MVFKRFLSGTNLWKTPLELGLDSSTQSIGSAMASLSSSSLGHATDTVAREAFTPAMSFSSLAQYSKLQLPIERALLPPGPYSVRQQDVLQTAHHSSSTKSHT